ncbi:hypothetical protein DFP72DRAFT_909432 [Ephemerocybe angulata]|uniref:F-box domain-containing protein n=1 Tax=Ephemerocybe angulata TaxID=980116 RepID=A0A8H6HQF3_9AGAR|nr:hypothetical protein DFP72DRAFT_909432 [Tulosesus angulatus]
MEARLPGTATGDRLRRGRDQISAQTVIRKSMESGVSPLVLTTSNSKPTTVTNLAEGTSMGPNMLDVLPEEILNLIVEAIAHNTRLGDTYSKMRLVCKIFSRLFEPKLFSQTTIDASVPFTPDQLKSFASGGPNCRWTRKLSITFIYQAEKMERGGRTLLELAIDGLRNLESARLFIQLHRPNEEVILALSQLPVLRQVELIFYDDWVFRCRGPLCFHQLANLRSLDLKNIPPCWVTEIRRTIANSPRLETLAIFFAESDPGPQGGPDFQPSSDWQDKDDEPVLDLAWIVKDTILSASHIFAPSLKTLSISGGSLALSASAIPYLGALTTVAIDLEDLKSVSDPSFWAGLSQAGVELRSLKLYPIAAPAIAYLASYVGLEELHVIRSAILASDAGNPTMAHELYHTVLVHHRDSLRVFRMDGVSRKVWAPRTEMSIPCLYPRDAPTDISIPTASDLISGIARELPAFRSLALEFNITEKRAQKFAEAVCDVKPSTSDSRFSFLVVLISRGELWCMEFYRDVGHFVIRE